MMDLCGVMLSKGMSYDLYWYGEMDAILSYYAKIEFENKTKELEIDMSAWLAGRYVQIAIASAFDKKNVYPAQPYVMKSMQSAEDKTINTFERLKAWSDRIKGKSGK